MAGESQTEPATGAPDPTTRTTEQMLQKVDDTESEIDAKFSAITARLDASDKATALLHDDFTRFPTDVQKEVGHLKELFDIRLNAEKEIAAIREAYRIELKADSKEALTTALAAAKEAVNAALAAAEKARDQETIRTQLANDKTEKQFAESLKQQNETNTQAMSAVVSVLNDVKDEVVRLRAQQLSIAENKIEQREVQTDQRTDQRGNNQQLLALAAVFIALISMLVAAGVLGPTGG